VSDPSDQLRGIKRFLLSEVLFQFEDVLFVVVVLCFQTWDKVLVECRKAIQVLGVLLFRLALIEELLQKPVEVCELPFLADLRLYWRSLV